MILGTPSSFSMRMNELITQINDALWGYVLIGALVAAGLRFTWKTKGVQFRMIGEMFRLLTDSAITGTDEHEVSGKSHKHISSFQAFAVSVATRVGTGNMRYGCLTTTGNKRKRASRNRPSLGANCLR